MCQVGKDNTAYAGGAITASAGGANTASGAGSITSDSWQRCKLFTRQASRGEYVIEELLQGTRHIEEVRRVIRDA